MRARIGPPAFLRVATISARGRQTQCLQVGWDLAAFRNRLDFPNCLVYVRTIPTGSPRGLAAGVQAMSAATCNRASAAAFCAENPDETPWIGIPARLDPATRPAAPRAAPPTADRLGLARQLLAVYEARRPGTARPRRCPSGLPALDEALGGGLPLATLCEVASAAAGLGALSLALRLAAAAGGERRLLVVDPAGQLYPPAIVQLGLRLSSLVFVRGVRSAQAVWAMEQALRCGAIGAVVGLFDALDVQAARRLQLAAEAGGSVGLLVNDRGRPMAERFAAVRLKVQTLGDAPESASVASTFRSRDIASSGDRAGGLRSAAPPSVRAARQLWVQVFSRRRDHSELVVLELGHAPRDVRVSALSGDRPGVALRRAVG